MTESDYPQFASELTRTAEVSSTELTPDRINLYFDELRDLSLEAVIAGVTQVRRTQRNFPHPSEIRQFVEGSINDRAELAWRTFLDLIRFEGEYPSLQVYDGAIAFAIVHLGGWPTACLRLGEASPEMVASYAKEFKSSYKLGAMRDEGPRYFVGKTEEANRSLGVWRSPTINQAVCLVRPGQIVRLEMPLDVTEGRLTDEARLALEGGGDALRQYLPLPAAPVKVLSPAPDAEMATQEEIDELLGKAKAIARGQRPTGETDYEQAKAEMWERWRRANEQV